MSDRLSSSPLRLLGTRDALTDLAAINTTILKNGSMVFVTALEDYFYLLKDSTAAADGISIVAPATGSAGRWFRAFIGGGQSFATQADWYVDPVNGADGNNGETAATALATMGELQRRLNDAYINQATTVHILNDVPNTDGFAPTLRIGPSGGVTFIGEGTTTLTTQVLTGAQAAVPAANTRESVTVAGFDWTPFIGQRLRITAGASVGAVSWVHRTGGSVAEAFVNRPVNPAGFSAGTFGVGNTVVVEQLTQIGPVSLAGVSTVRNAATDGGPVLFVDLSFNRSGVADDMVIAQEVSFYGCDVDVSIIMLLEGGFSSGSKLRYFVLSSLALFGIYGGTIEPQPVGEIRNSPEVIVFLPPSVISRALSLYATNLRTNADIGIWDWTAGPGLSVIDNSQFNVTTSVRVWGTSAIANTYGIQVRDAICRYRSAAVLPTIVGALTATKDAEVGSSTTQVSGTYAALLPFINPDNLAQLTES